MKNIKKQLEKIEEEMSIKSRRGDLNRARSITIGSAFGGITEISMRSNDGTPIFALFQPVEVIELIHQLAANVGCHIHIQPRKDFSSWRDWKYTEEELNHYRGNQFGAGFGYPPIANGIDPYKDIGARLPLPEQQPGLQHQTTLKDNQNETVAAEKPKHKRSTKRATTTT